MFTLLLFVNVFVFYLEDMCKGLVLGPPVKEVVPVVTSSQLLLAVHDAVGDGTINTKGKARYGIMNTKYQYMCAKQDGSLM